MADNHFPPGDCCRGMSVMGASRSCSGSYNARDEQRTCGKAEAGGSWLGCSGNETSKLGRDCTPFADSGIGSYKGAMNLQLAWRRNDMSCRTDGWSRAFWGWHPGSLRQKAFEA